MTDSSPSSSLIEQSREFRKNPTEAETILWEHLRNRRLENYKIRRQHPICGYILDFYCQEIRLGIEVDGEVHQTQEQIAYDNQRSIDLSEIGIKVIRFRNSEVIRSVDEVLQQILLSLECKSKQ